MPTRFKYIPVQPQNFALTPAEILMATDQELNEYVSVKKYAPYRKEVRWDSTRNERLKELKNKVSERVPHEFAAGSSRDGAGASDRPVKKRKGKKERMKMKAGDADGDNADGAEIKATIGATPSVSTQKRKREATEADGTGVGTQGTLGKKKRRRKQKESNGAEI